nr:restriction endonuclease subunit S [Rhodococcus sp. HNM0563]
MLDALPVAAGELASAKFVFEPGDILYGKLRPYLAKITIPGFAGVCSTDILPIRVSEVVDARFLLHYLRQPSLVEWANARSAGANLPRLSPKELATLPVPLPPIEEQRRIAAVLDHTDALRTKRREALARLDELTQSIFIDMFGDPVLNPKKWELATLGAVGTLDRGVSKHRPRNAAELLGTEHPLVQTGEVANSDGYILSTGQYYSDLGLRQSKKWPAGTLCITIAANIAKTGILMFDACFPDSVVGFTANPSTVEYVRVWLSFLQRTIEASAPESAQKNINLAILRALSIPLPPQHLRDDFAERITRTSELKAGHHAALAELDALFASLQSRAFRGEL